LKGGGGRKRVRKNPTPEGEDNSRNHAEITQKKKGGWQRVVAEVLSTEAKGEGGGVAGESGQR